MSTQDEMNKIPQSAAEEAMEQRNDALFKALDKSRKQKKRRIITTVLILLLSLTMAPPSCRKIHLGLLREARIPLLR